MIQKARHNLLALPDGLQSDGSPDAKWIPSHLANYGYACPRQQFVESVVPVRQSELSRIWNVSVSTLGLWVKQQDWKGQRERYWLRCQAQAGDMTLERVAATRAKELEARYNGWIHLRGVLDAMILRGGKEEQSATGKVQFTPFSPADLEKLAQARERIEKNIDAALGMARVSAAVRADLDDSDAQPVKRRLTLNLTVEERDGALARVARAESEESPEQESPKELPSPQEYPRQGPRIPDLSELGQKVGELVQAEILSSR